VPGRAIQYRLELRVAMERFPIVIAADGFDVGISVLECFFEPVERYLAIPFNRRASREGVPGIRN
jgi:hypothetical protein